MTGTVSAVITGLALRLPGARTRDEFWRLLVDGVDRTAEVSEHRRDLVGAPEWRDVVGEVEGVELFDAEFFGIDPDEARFMDPQHRLALEVAHEALADAGLLEADGERGRRYAVLAAITNNAYHSLVDRAVRAGAPIHPRAVVNNSASAAATRLSHTFGLTGPSMAIDTACSSFLTALAQAVDAIRHQGCEGAVVAGAHVLSSPYNLELCRAGGITTTSGFTRVFDEDADGTLLGEGAVVCVLEREDLARARNRRILGRIVGSAVNNDGASLNVMAPNPAGQAAVIRDCYAQGIDHRRIGYVEAHGTGTRIGDPIELNALGKVYRQEDFGEARVGIGSVKSNIGHLLNAAGGAGLAKLLLTLEHGTMAPNVHLDSVNPLLEVERTPFELMTEPRPWPRREERTRVGAITSLGLGGTNVHVVVEEGEADRPGPTLERAPLCVSAKTERALDAQLAELRELVGRADPYNLAMTLARFRTAHAHRAVVDLDVASGALVERGRRVVERPAKRVLLRGAEADVARITRLLGGRARASDEAPRRGELAAAIGPADEAGALALDPARDDLDLAATLFLHGGRVAWVEVFPDGTGTILRLPSYPFEREPHWLAVP